MYRIHIRNGRKGMVCAKDIYMGTQLLLSEDTILTEKHLARLRFYDINQIFITEKEDGLNHVEITDEMKVEIKSYMNAISQALPEIRNSFNDVVRKNMEIDTAHLLSMVRDVFEENDYAIRMLPSMRALKDVDDLTYIHSINVSLICHLFGQWLKMDEHELGVLTLAGLLHDIGKLKIPKKIIQKPGKLTNDEYNVVKRHTAYGYEILKEKNIDNRIKEVALWHHERCDGKGYPYGLKGDKIPLFAKIVAIADVYDAMTADRVYRHGLCPFDVIDIFETEGLHQFDVKLIVMLLTKIAESYINESVRLSDGREGKVVLLNKERLARPVVQLEDGFIDLSQQVDLHIEAVLGM